MMRAWIGVVGFAVLFFGALGSAGAGEETHFFDRTPYRILMQDENSLRELKALNLDIERGSVGSEPAVIGYLNEEERNLLTDLGYVVKPIPNQALLMFRQLLAETAGTDDPLREYHTYEEMVAELQAVATAHPTLCRLYNIGPTVQNRALWFMKISDNVSQEEDELEFRYIAAIHGDEVVGKEMCMYLINYLVDNYGTDPVVTDLVNETEIWILPSMNPDGTAAASRYNANGVDLNRNFPDRVSDPYNTTAGRQPETADVMNWNFAHQPIMSANFHGGTLVANYPWDGCWDPQANHFYTTNQDWVLPAAETYSYNNPPMWANNTPPFVHGTVNGVDWYQVTGGLQDWSYNWMGDMDITMEISTIKWPASTTLPGFWEDNRPAMLAYMQFAHRGIRGVVTDAVTGLPLNAQVKVVGRYDFTVNTDPDVGDFHYPLMPGVYSFDVTSFGYWPSHQTGVQVAQGDPTRVDVALQPAALMTFAGILHNGTGGGLSARATLLNTPYDPVLTNPNGEFAFDDVYEGEYILRLESLTDGALIQFPIVLTAGMQPLELWGPVALFYDGFEAGLTSWSPQGTWGTSGNAYAGSLSAADSPSGNYGNNLNISLTKNSPLDLSGYDYTALSYRTRFNCETNYDTLYAEVSADGFIWNPINFHNSRQDEWSLEVRDVSAYAGSTALNLRFRLKTDGSVVRDGGFVDEVRVSAASDSPFGTPQVTIALSPYGTPIQIPAGGGSFTYNISASNAETTPVAVSVWCDVTLPNGNPYGPTLGPVSITLAAGQTLNRDRNQSVPGVAPAGTYTYHAYIGQYPDVVWDEDSFIFTKAGVDAGGSEGWANSGEDFLMDSSPTVPPPADYILAQNFPNPFNPETRICFALPREGHVTIKAYNAQGRLVQLILDEDRAAGWHQVQWDASHLTTGLYLYRMETEGHTFTQKAILIK
jgi:carboxypeptidase D